MRRFVLLLIATWTTLGAPAVCMAGRTPCCAGDPAPPALPAEPCCDRDGDGNDGDTPCDEQPAGRSCEGCGLLCGTAVKLPDENRVEAPSPAPLLLRADFLTPRAAEMLGTVCQIEISAFGWGATALDSIALLI